jgi:lipoyl(octanoyl) transferase
MDLEKQPTPEHTVQFEDWGLMDYLEASAKQLETLEKVFHDDKLPGIIAFCTHPPVVTKGRATIEGDITDWQGQTVEVSRGGRATYHGPSQLVVYPIVYLKYARKGRQPKEVVGFLRDFEQAIVDTLAEYGLRAVGKSLQKNREIVEEATGVWVGDRKIASLGIAVKKWVTYHGAAINLDDDPLAFKGLMPCGFQPSVMTNLERLTGKKVDRQEFQKRLQAQLQKAL